RRRSGRLRPDLHPAPGPDQGIRLRARHPRQAGLGLADVQGPVRRDAQEDRGPGRRGRRAPRPLRKHARNAGGRVPPEGAGQRRRPEVREAARGQGRKGVMATIGRVWAIARMTLLEASRRKVFTILLLFAAALLSSVLFFPSVEIEGRLRLIEIWALRASAVFTAIVGLFLAGFSLPQDFETKRIYMVVTKPISKPLVFLGRYLGY